MICAKSCTGMRYFMDHFWDDITAAGRIAIAGHIRPDGDCVGSCMALYHYIQENYNKTNEKIIHVILETVPDVLKIIQGTEQIICDYPKMPPYGLFITVDCGDVDRLGKAEEYYNEAAITYVLDHHISNTGFGQKCLIRPEASSTCELLYEIMEDDRISFKTAEALYLGIVHDTGVFKHSNTTEKTMRVAGRMLAKGVSSSKIINKTFYEKTYIQKQILGRCFMESILLMDGKVIVTGVSKKMQKFYGIDSSDLDGVVDQLRVTKGVEVAILLKEEGTLEYKVSMRSNEVVDVSKIAVFFGGGGHVRAAGCTMTGSLHDVVNNLTHGIEAQIKKAEMC